MNLDLNNPKEFTLAGVKALIASKPDTQSYQLRVTIKGVAYLSNTVDAEHREGMAFRLEAWEEGNGYVGLDASNDQAWVQRIYDCLNHNWPEPESTYIDSY